MLCLWAPSSHVNFGTMLKQTCLWNYTCSIIQDLVVLIFKMYALTCFLSNKNSLQYKLISKLSRIIHTGVGRSGFTVVRMPNTQILFLYYYLYYNCKPTVAHLCVLLCAYKVLLTNAQLSCHILFLNALISI